MKTPARFATLLLLVFLALPTVWAHSARAQTLSPRFGLGFSTMLSTPDGLGFGMRGRISAPVNADLSLAVDLGFTGFFLGGRDDATWVFDPQVSAIVTLPYETSRATYVIAGVGAYVPMESKDDDPVSGPTVHFGAGRVQLLRETTFYYELDPMIIIGENSVHLAIPLRVGVIF